MDRKKSEEPRVGHTEARDLLNTVEVAEIVRLSRRTLERGRVTGEGPEYIKLGRRVVYQKCKVDEWLEQGRRRSTSDPGSKPKKR